MTDPNQPSSAHSSASAQISQPASTVTSADEPDFAQLLEEYEGGSEQAGPEAGERRSGRVVSVRDDVMLVDIGAKAEGVLPIEAWRSGPGANGSAPPSAGETIEVVVEGRDAEGSFKLSPFTPDRPRNVDDARRAYEEKTVVRGKVTGVIKGGLTVDVGMRAFMPQSKSGVRDAAEMHKLVGQEIQARIARPPEKNNLVLDRRSLLEEQHRAQQKETLEKLREGDEVTGRVSSLATYGAFVDIGGVDALLHISDMSWTRLAEPGRLLALNDEVRVKVLKIDSGKRRISVGLKQLTPDPWADVLERFHTGDRVRGVVQRTSEFGAFVELAPGIEGLIHISEMSWSRRVRKADDVVKVGEVVEAVVLGVNPAERRISLGLKQALGDPWAEAQTRYAQGAVVEGKVRNLQPFGAFIEIAEGVDGMIHIADISNDRIKHPSDALKVGDVVRAQVLELDLPKRRLRLGMKQLEPTPFENFCKTHNFGEVLTGRVVKAYPGRVEFDDGIAADCPSAAPPVRKIEEGTFAAKLAAVRKPVAKEPQPEPDVPKVQLKPGEVRKFKISRIEADPPKFEVELA